MMIPDGISCDGGNTDLGGGGGADGIGRIRACCDAIFSLQMNGGAQ